MFNVLYLRLFVATLRKAIALSDKRSTRAWNILALVFLFLLCVSVAMLMCQQHPSHSAPLLAKDMRDVYPTPVCESPGTDCSGYFLRLMRDLPKDSLPVTITGGDPLNIAPGKEFTITVQADPESAALSYQWYAGTEATAPITYWVRLSHLAADYGSTSIDDHLHFVLRAHAFTLSTQNPITQNIYYIQAAPEQKPSDDTQVWIAMILNALGLLYSSIMSWIAHKRLEAEYLLKKQETELRLKEMELKLIQLQREVDSGKSPPLISL